MIILFGSMVVTIIRIVLEMLVLSQYAVSLVGMMIRSHVLVWGIDSIAIIGIVIIIVLISDAVIEWQSFDRIGYVAVDIHYWPIIQGTTTYTRQRSRGIISVGIIDVVIIIIISIANRRRSIKMNKWRW